MNKTRHLNLLTVFILATLGLNACSITFGQVDARTVSGSGAIVEETRAVSDVTSVELATIGTLHIEVGTSEELVIEAQDDLMAYIDTYVLNGKLRIETRDNVSLLPTRQIHYYLTVTNLGSIAISSSGDIEAPDLEAEQFSISVASSGKLEMGDLEAGALSVNISSSGDVMMGALNANTLEVDITSTGNLEIAGGEVKTQNITISSSGKYRAEDMASDEADVRLNSSGSATIWVYDYLKANLSSSGDLRYRGNPTVDATTSSSGDIIQIGD